MKPIIFLIITLLLFAGCAPSTQLTKSWVDPTYNTATAKPFTKVLIIAKIKSETTRRLAEDKIVAQFLTAGTAIPSYSYIPENDTNFVKIEERLKADGFDGIIRMRLVNIEKSLTYTPGTAYGGYEYGWYGGYGYAYPSPGYYSEDQTYTVETNIYSLELNKLIWSGTTSTLDPTSFEQSLNDIIAVIKADLEKKGLIKGDISGMEKK